ncbi:MAG: hypothetical protein JXR70_18360 [Spirochaetales bacterium]|nr:hypothetical protein [Spirochaetales bacterium]
MKKIVFVLIALIAVSVVVRTYAAESQDRFSIHPSLIEYSDEDNELSVGFGLVESNGTKTQTWNLFPIRVMLRSGKTRMYLGLNGLSLLTQSGVNFQNELMINQTHKGDLVSFGGKVIISGKVEGNVWVFSADVVLKKNAVVLGDVVALGGKVIQEGWADIRGNKTSLPEFKIPFLGLLASQDSIGTILFIVEFFGILLFLLVLFLFLFFRSDLLINQTNLMFTNWKTALLYIFLSLLIIPVLIFFLTASVIGVLLIPILFVFIVLLGFSGFLSVAIRMGKIFLRNDSPSLAYLFLCGLVGMFVIKGPGLLGILLKLTSADAIVFIGNLLVSISSIALFVGVLYGFATALHQFKNNS